MRSLEGRRIALLESRKQQELCSLVQRLGGVPVCAATVRERATGADMTPLITRIVEGRYAVAVVLTAVAFSTLCDESNRQGLLPQVRDAFARMVIGSRGPKPQLALRKQSLNASIVSSSPHTSAELLDALSSVSVEGLGVLVLHYGELSDQIGTTLRARGASVDDACLYEWHLPEDITPIEAMVHALLNDEMEALIVTSQIQCRHLLQVARAMRLEDALLEKLQRDIVVAAIGPVCGKALRDVGIVADIMPDIPNSPALVRAVGDYFSLMSDSPEEMR